jgi:hypothetical protein
MRKLIALAWLLWPSRSLDSPRAGLRPGQSDKARQDPQVSLLWALLQEQGLLAVRRCLR